MQELLEETRTGHTHEVLNVGVSLIIKRKKKQGFKMSNYICQNTFYFISFFLFEIGSQWQLL